MVSTIKTHCSRVFAQNSMARTVSATFVFLFFVYLNHLLKVGINNDWTVFNQFILLPMNHLQKRSKNSACVVMKFLRRVCWSIVTKNESSALKVR